jgi:hypothetical protein
MVVGRPRDRADEAQHVINLAAEDGYFERFLNLKNCRATWAGLREAALELLAGAYPDLDIKVHAQPDSAEVQLKVVPRRL